MTSWEVIGQTPDQIETAEDGTPTTGVYVRFKTGLGEIARVFIDNKLYSDVDAVKRAIDARAAMADQVRQLHSEG